MEEEQEFSFFFFVFPLIISGPVTPNVTHVIYLFIYFLFNFIYSTTGDAQTSNLHGPPGREVMTHTHAEQMMFLCSGQAPHTCQIKFSLLSFLPFAAGVGEGGGGGGGVWPRDYRS